MTAALSLAGGAAWGFLAPDSLPAVVAGLATAWVVQAGAFWHLAGRLARGRAALRAWITGVAARIGGLAALAVTAGPAGWSLATLVVAYGAAVVALLMLEVLWLWKRAQQRPSRR